jgi:hypothetical protein
LRWSWAPAWPEIDPLGRTLAVFELAGAENVIFSQDPFSAIAEVLLHYLSV